MSIPYQPNKPKLIPLKEAAIRNNARFINEAAHAFEKQYEISRMVAERIYEAILQGTSYLRIPFNGEFEHYIFNGVNVNIVHEDILKTTGRITSLGLEKGGMAFPTIEVHPFVLIKKIERSVAVKDIASVVAHELTHAYVTYKYNMMKIDDEKVSLNLDLYQKYIEIIGKEGEMENSIAYDFCYAMYSIYYQEMQAFVSQTYPEVLKILDATYGTYEVSNDQFRRAIIRTNTYLTYYQNARTANRLIRSRSLRLSLSNQLKKYNLILSDKDILTKAKRIAVKSRLALGKAYNNAYEFHFVLPEKDQPKEKKRRLD